MLLMVVALFVLASCGGGGGGGNGLPAIPDPGVGEGDIGAAKSLGTAPISYNGAAGAFAESYYSFHTGSSNAMYTISLTNMQTDLSWYLFSNSGFSTPVQICDHPGVGVEEICTTSIDLNANADYYLLVDNYWNDTGTTYKLTISVTPVPAAPAITVTAGHLQNVIKWTPVANATRYTVYESTSSSVSKTSFANKYTYATSPYIHAGVSAGTSYYYVVTAENINGESAESGVQSATPMTALSSLSTNFDNGTLQGWTAAGTWGLTQSASNSGSYSLTDSPAGNYGEYANMSLTSPVVDLSSSATPTLSFYQKYDIGTYDHGYIDVSSDGGVTFSNNVASYNGTQAAFTQTSISLTSYQSSTVVVRFRFYSSFVNPGTHDGWYLDDISIQ